MLFGNRLTLFSLFGIRIRVDASWLLLAGLIVWSLASGYFPETAPGLPPADYWWLAGVGLAGLAASIVAHELAHAVVGRRFRMSIRGITLFIFGGVAEMEDEPDSAKGEFLMAVAGPLVSFAAAGLFHLTDWLVEDGQGPVSAVAAYLALLNLLLGAFNLVPAYPLDGGRMLRAALWAWRGDVLWATRLAARLGGVVGLLLMLWGVWDVLTLDPVVGLWRMVLGLFLRVAAAQAWGRTAARAREAEMIAKVS